MYILRFAVVARDTSKDIELTEPSLKGISSSDKERRFLFTEWKTNFIADGRLGYLIFFLEDPLKLVIFDKNSNHFRGFLLIIETAKFKNTFFPLNHAVSPL